MSIEAEGRSSAFFTVFFKGGSWQKAGCFRMKDESLLINVHFLNFFLFGKRVKMNFGFK